MKNTLVVGIVAFSFLMSTSSAAPSCGASKLISPAPCKNRDIGARPHAKCETSLKAPKGYYFVKKEIKKGKKGSTHVKRERFTTKHYSKLTPEAKSWVGDKILSSASYTVECWRGRTIGRRSCYAATYMSAKAYPHQCLKEKLKRGLGF